MHGFAMPCPDIVAKLILPRIQGQLCLMLLALPSMNLVSTALSSQASSVLRYAGREVPHSFEPLPATLFLL